MIQITSTQISVNSSAELEAEKARLEKEGYILEDCFSSKDVEQWVYRKEEGTCVSTVTILA